MSNTNAANRPDTIAIWVDADACPRIIREVLFRAATRVAVPLTLVANHTIAVPPSRWVSAILVEQGFDVADNFIVRKVRSGDLVITADIPLAAELIEKGAGVISPRGEQFTRNNIRQRLNMRDFMETMRSSVQVGGGPPALGPRDKQAFANALDRYLATHVRRAGE
jgi:uncharacterized protein YaiI (UPF0178 family)